MLKAKCERAIFVEVSADRWGGCGECDPTKGRYASNLLDLVGGNSLGSSSARGKELAGEASDEGTGKK